MAVRDLLYHVYERRLERELAGGTLPRHVGVILDGNRRYARERGLASVAEGYLAGADRIPDLLDWCFELRIPYVTLWLLSTDNLSRADDELTHLLDIIVGTVQSIASAPSTATRKLRVTAVGVLDALPVDVREALEEACAATADNDGFHVQIAVGYGGRKEITDALRSWMRAQDRDGHTLADAAEALVPADIGDHLYTTGFPDPDLIIRTSGELRLSGFLLWQSAHSEFYFCDPYWPDFRKVDFLRALRDYAGRARRFGR
ncbi:polyprenyl diphosphate synthase [Salsipaludibacter albus]|uniref:polyprenyl diphosphate synthase n=1 Tax=Salsipaludibacter albus TaxID=2849650 RepID=UPI001EE427A0|nr:polyprenyl diphosphate synthase [Salsipaludibacter albus]MBY5162558.1 di-trans,poly-cis-decaprenylcistransferase [Salsipaludibacter albus]